MLNLVIAIVALLLSAFFSGSETALISARRIKLEVWTRQKRRGAQEAMNYLDFPERYLSTILVGNNIAVITASSIMAVYLEQVFSGVIITLISSVILLFLGEMLPKSIGRDQGTILTLRITPILRFFYVLFFPVIRVVTWFSQVLLKFMGQDSGSVKRFFTRRDLAILAKEGESSGLVKSDEASLISRFILRGDLKVRDVMIPRTEMTVVPKTKPILEVMKLFEKTGYSRLPVRGKTIDEILGIVTVRDVLLEKPANVLSIIRECLYIPETSKVITLLAMMQETGKGLAIVVDEYGGTAGLITLEDIIEEFFGDIQDEYDDEASLFRKIAPRQIDVRGIAHIHDLNERFNLGLPEGDYQTLSGLLMDSLGHIPKRGEKFDLDTCTLVVLSAYRRKVSWVRIIRKWRRPTGRK